MSETTTPQTTAIVTYGRGWPALAVTRSLGRRGVRVVCGDSVGFAPSFFSRYCEANFRYPDPAQDPAGFLDAVERIARRELERGLGPVVLMPVHSETYLITQHRERFEALGVRLALPRHQDIQQTRDKGRLADLADELGIKIPTTHRLSSMSEVYKAAPDLAYPVFVKVRGSAAGVGIQKVSDPEELVAVVRDFVDGYELGPDQFPLLQEGVPGDDLCVSALFEQGRCVAVHTYRNVRQFPRTTGAGVLRETVAAPEAEAEACRLLSHLGWHGLAQLDFRWTEGETPYLIELNPRFFGGLPQAIAAGVDHPWMLLQLALGESPASPTIDPQPRTETPILGLLATFSQIRHDDELHAGLRALRETLESQPGGPGRWQRFHAFLRELGAQANPSNVAAYLRGKLAVHRGTINDVIQSDDLMPVLGVLFPLSVALKHGTLDTAVVLSEARKKKADTPRVGFRGYLKPSWITLAAMSLVFLVSVAVTQAGALDGGLLDRAFSWPAALSARALPSGGAPGYALFHLANVGFLYFLAACGLATRERVARARSIA
jgi:predicted ATP-grasp superfamily ATP-dependent carboligase